MAISTQISASGIRNIKRVLSTIKGAEIGLDDMHLAAIGGNLAQESGGDTTSYNNYGCAGICQWGGSRPFNSNVPAAPGTYNGVLNTPGGQAHVRTIIAADAETQAHWIVNELRSGKIAGFSLTRFNGIRDYNSAVLYWCTKYEVPFTNVNSGQNRNVYYARLIMGRKYFGSGISASFYQYDTASDASLNLPTEPPPIILPKVTYSAISNGDWNDDALDFDTITEDSTYDDFINAAVTENSTGNSTSQPANAAVTSSADAAANAAQKISVKTPTATMSKDAVANNTEKAAIANETKATVSKEEASTTIGGSNESNKTEQIQAPADNLLARSAETTTSTNSAGFNDSALDFDTIDENTSTDDL